MKKTFIDWLRGMFRENPLPSGEIVSPPPEETLQKLIDKTINQNNAKNDEGENEEDSGSTDVAATPDEADGGNNEESEKEGKSAVESCPYALKRNIVASMAEIRRFAEEHELAAAVVKALLTALAEIAVNAMRGKVNGAALLMILNALNFDKARGEAYREGEIAGRNARIEETYFPKTDEGIPRFQGLKSKSRNSSDIFSLADDAC